MEATSFGRTPDGTETHVFELRSANARVRVSDFGATLVGVDVPDRDGRLADVLLGFASVEGYAGENGACYGGVIGPIANRTDRAEVPVGGVTYHLPGNDGPDGRNNLHSDLVRGLHKRLWAVVDEGPDALTLGCELADGELGLPGNRAFTARYALTEPEEGVVELRIDFGCTTDAATYVNMTSHAYVNLAGHDAGDVLGEVVSVDADEFLPLRADSVSEGTIRDVTGTPFDFRSPKALGADIDADDDQLERARGYDHCLCVRGWKPGAPARHAMRAEEAASGRALDVLITMPGAHLYTGNWLDDAAPLTKGGATYRPRAGLAFEPEFYPDAPHHANWPQPVCEPGRPYAQTIVYRFSTL